MSDAADNPDEAPHRTALLPAELSEDQLAAAPVLESVDTLVIEELSADEDEAFAAALASRDSSSTPACSAPPSAGDAAIGAPLVTADNIFADVPGLALHR